MPSTADQAPPSAPTSKAAAAPDPDRDAKALVKQGAERPTSTGEIGAHPSDVFAEDWWSQARPVFEIHGYYRVRAELFHKLSLGRRDEPSLFWPQPADNTYIDRLGTGHGVLLCGKDPAKPEVCENNTQAGGNMRFRLNPELHISDNLRVMSQIDLLDNVVLGSTPEGYANLPSGSGYTVVSPGGYTPYGGFASTQWAPVAGVNTAATNALTVKRVWGEYTTPVGVLHFGRMPSHWGLGLLANRGDGHDSDYQSTVDRIMLITGIKRWDLYFAGAFDFANEGATSATLGQQEGQPYDIAQLDDENQYVLMALRRRNPELQKLELAKGEAVINGGVYFALRNQVIANDVSRPARLPNSGDMVGQGGSAVDASIGQNPEKVRQGYFRRGLTTYTPDVWFQFLYRKFRFEVEAAAVIGSVDNTVTTAGAESNYNKEGWQIRQFGVATQSEFRAIEDKLRIQFGFGYSSGDPDVDSLTSGGNGLQSQLTTNRTFSRFQFHPDYRVDLILFRHILNQVQGAYYFRPSIDYDFARDKNGQRLGAGAAAIWSRASEFIQTPGHARDLGIELNFQIYYQSKDGTLNDDPDKMGGFFTSLQYGVLFPLGGLGYLPNSKDSAGLPLDVETAQTLRWFLGVVY
jgi:uncharacterized protein (TIGR04551 family)